MLEMRFEKCAVRRFGYDSASVRRAILIMEHFVLVRVQMRSNTGCVYTPGTMETLAGMPVRASLQVRLLHNVRAQARYGGLLRARYL